MSEKARIRKVIIQKCSDYPNRWKLIKDLEERRMKKLEIERKLRYDRRVRTLKSWCKVSEIDVDLSNQPAKSYFHSLLLKLDTGDGVYRLLVRYSNKQRFTTYNFRVKDGKCEYLGKNKKDTINRKKKSRDITYEKP